MFQCSSTTVNQKKRDSVSAVKVQRRIFHQSENIYYFSQSKFFSNFKTSLKSQNKISVIKYKCFAWKSKNNYLIFLFFEIGPGKLIEEINFMKKTVIKIEIPN